jgi:HNH endonuclease
VYLTKVITKIELQELLKIELVYSKGRKYPELEKCWFKKGIDWSNYCTINKEYGHRLVYRLVNGPIKEGYIICHKCDRKGCINPDHLFQGTDSDNHRDSVNKGRAYKRYLFKFNKNKKELEKLKERDKWKRLVRLAGEK